MRSPSATAPNSGGTKKTICLVKVDQEIYKNVPPLGLLYLGNALKKAGYRVKIFHIVAGEIDSYRQAIIDEKPLFVGFSVLTGWEIRPAARLSRVIQREIGVPIVWGSVHPSLMPEQCLDEDYIDAVCIGEGEETVVELARAIENNSGFAEIKGIGYKDKDGRIKINEAREFISNLDTFEPEWSLADVERYVIPSWGVGRTLRVIASRGCPYGCSFCYNLAFNKRRWRSHSVDYAIDHFRSLARAHDLKAIYFNDDNFFVKSSWAWRIIEGVGLPYYVSLRAELVDEGFAAHLSATNCRELLIGYESGSDRVLEEILKKGSKVEEHTRATEFLSLYPRIKIAGSFITALPDETPEDFQDTLRVIKYYLRIHPNIRIILAFFRPLPGTEIYAAALRRGFVPPENTEGWSDYDCLANRHDLPWMTEETNERIGAVCRTMDILAALYKFNIPVLKPLVRSMVLRDCYHSPFLAFLDRIRTNYAFGENQNLGIRWVRQIVNVAKACKKLD